MNGRKLLHLLTGVPLDEGCGFIKDKYDNTDTDKQISIIRDILDFYTDKAKFAEQKYYVQLIKDDEYSYLSISWAGVVELYGNRACNGWKNKFTRDEVVAIDPKLVPFMEEVEDDE